MLPVLLFVGALSAAWYILIVRPQKQQQHQHESLVGHLTVGDYVMTVGGVYGHVQAISGDSALLEVAPHVCIRVNLDAIAHALPVTSNMFEQHQLDSLRKLGLDDREASAHQAVAQGPVQTVQYGHPQPVQPQPAQHSFRASVVPAERPAVAVNATPVAPPAPGAAPMNSTNVVTAKNAQGDMRVMLDRAREEREALAAEYRRASEPLVQQAGHPAPVPAMVAVAGGGQPVMVAGTHAAPAIATEHQQQLPAPAPSVPLFVSQQRELERQRSEQQTRYPAQVPLQPAAHVPAPPMPQAQRALAQGAAAQAAPLPFRTRVPYAPEVDGANPGGLLRHDDPMADLLEVIPAHSRADS